MEPGTARRLTTAWCLALAGAAFYPFAPEYRGPRPVASGLARGADGTVTFEGPAVLRTPAAPRWLAGALAAESLTVALEARSATADQQGPARIVTLSQDAYRRNLTIAQKGPDLLVRARRPGADGNGAPPLKVDGVFEVPRWLSIEVRIGARRIDVFVDGERRAWERFEEPVFATWDAGHRLALGDEVDGARGWRGALRGLTAAVDDRLHDPLGDPALEAPERFWVVPEPTRRLLRFDPSHAVPVEGAHLVAFVPLGALLALGSMAGRRALRIALVAALFGALLQLGKLGFASRHPSLYHALFNGAGAALGALWVRRRGARD